MNLITNNIKALAVHLCSLPLFLIGLIIFVAGSPLYKFQAVALSLMIFLYGCGYLLYMSVLIRILKISKHRISDYLSGVSVVIVGWIIWGTIYYSKASSIEMTQISEVWIPYNLYNFLLWPLSYGIKDPKILMIIGTLNGIFAPMAILLKRRKII